MHESLNGLAQAHWECEISIQRTNKRGGAIRSPRPRPSDTGATGIVLMAYSYQMEPEAPVTVVVPV